MPDLRILGKKSKECMILIINRLIEFYRENAKK